MNIALTIFFLFVFPVLVTALTAYIWFRFYFAHCQRRRKRIAEIINNSGEDAWAFMCPGCDSLWRNMTSKKGKPIIVTCWKGHKFTPKFTKPRDSTSRIEVIL